MSDVHRVQGLLADGVDHRRVGHVDWLRQPLVHGTAVNAIERDPYRVEGLLVRLGVFVEVVLVFVLFAEIGRVQQFLDYLLVRMLGYLLFWTRQLLLYCVFCFINFDWLDFLVDSLIFYLIVKFASGAQ